MSSPPVMLCERTGSWADAIRTALARRGVEPMPRVVETRSPTECRRRFESSAARGENALLVVELTAENAAAVCELLVHHLRRLPRSPRFAVAGRELQTYEAAVREAGGMSLLTSPRELRPLVETYLRYRETVATDSAALVDDELPLAERLWATLPWGPRV